jgi:hypothetical protein
MGRAVPQNRGRAPPVSASEKPGEDQPDLFARRYASLSRPPPNCAGLPITQPVHCEAVESVKGVAHSGLNQADMREMITPPGTLSARFALDART